MPGPPSSMSATKEQKEKRLFASVRQESKSTESKLRVPAMTAAVNAENYDQMLSKSEHFFETLEKSRVDSFALVKDHAGVLGERVFAATACAKREVLVDVCRSVCLTTIIALVGSRINASLNKSIQLLNALDNLDKHLEEQKRMWQSRVEEDRAVSKSTVAA